MTLSTINLGPGLHIQRIIHGLWQVSGTHGPIHPMRAIEHLHAYHSLGFRAWDVADHYGPAEDFIGTFLEELDEKFGTTERGNVTVLTKWVPTHPEKRDVADVDYTAAYVEKNIDRSLKRMRVDTLDLLQFHWWNYDDPRMMDAFQGLLRMVEKGKIRSLGVTNFNGENLKTLLKAGLPIVSNQVRFSLLDRRALTDVVPVCEQYGIHLIAFGTLCGGWIQRKHLGASNPYETIPFASRSGYHKLINNFGGWKTFQRLLAALESVANRKGTSLSTVASRYILDQPRVAAVIVGARLGESLHAEEHLEIDRLHLTDHDRTEIEAALSQARDLTHLLGPVASEYRSSGFAEQPELT